MCFFDDVLYFFLICHRYIVVINLDLQSLIVKLKNQSKMKNKASIIYGMFVVCLIFFSSCSNYDEDVKFDKDELDVELTESDIVLKNKMEEAAKIIADIANDKLVLNEIASTIKKQPAIIEDRVKFSEMMGVSAEKSIDIKKDQSYFANAFKNELSKENLKSASNLIEYLTSQGVEINIPYPLEDYPEGTDVIVTSHPMDNYYENTGYFIKSGKEVIVDEELTLKYPVIIVWPSTVSDVDVENYKNENEQKSLECDDIKLQTGNLKSAHPTDIQDMSDWDSEDVGHKIIIRYLYVKDDHRSGLFKDPSRVYFGTTTPKFNSTNKLIISNDGEGKKCIFSKTIRPKYERWAENGYDKGWVDCGQQILISDWQPAIKETTFAAWVDVDKSNNSFTIDLASVASAILKVLPDGTITKLLSKAFDAIDLEYEYEEVVQDVLYGTIPMPRYTYKHLYNSTGTKWGENNETNKHFDGLGRRPALQISPDLLYLTKYETYDIN